MKKKLRIQMLGSFELEYGEKRLSAEGHQNEKTWIMLAYLLLNRAPIKAEELYRAIEGKEPEGDPARTMKNQLYRLRKMLDQLDFLPGSRLVLYNQGEYGWNREIECEIDLDYFWNWIEKAEKARSAGQKSHYYRNALQYYRGELFSEFFYFPWLCDERDWLESAFQMAVEVVVKKLEDNEAWEDSEMFCKEMMQRNPDSLFLKNHYLLALVREEKTEEALQYTLALQEEWGRDYGVSLGELWPDLYQLPGAKDRAKYLDMDYLQHQIMEDTPAKGAFFSDMGVFRSAYQLMLRTADRYQLNIWLCQLSFRNLGFGNTENGFEKEKSWVCSLLQNTLRKGDLATGYCPGEYLLLLTVEHEYDLPRIFRRIAERCGKENGNAFLSVQYERVTRLLKEPIRKWTMQNG